MSANKRIVLKATDFHYPTKEELKKVRNIEPMFTLFSFPYADIISAFFNDEENLTPNEILKKSHLYWWNHSLTNRIGSLTHAYTLALVNFNRGFPDDFKNCNDQNYINRIQFDFYCETYFYFFASVRDTIAQIMNVYYDIDYEEDNIHFNKKFTAKISNDKVKDITNQFISDTSDTINFRNKFTHRFVVTHPDYRPSYTKKDGKQILGAGLGNFTKSSDLANQIKASLEQLASFIADLGKLMI